MTFRAATLVLLFIPRQRAEEFVEVRGDRFGEGEEPDARLVLLAVLAVEFLEDLLRRFRRVGCVKSSERTTNAISAPILVCSEDITHPTSLLGVKLWIVRAKVAFTAPREVSRVQKEPA